MGEPLIPSLCSILPGSKPSRSDSTMKALIRLLSRSVLAKTT